MVSFDIATLLRHAHSGLRWLALFLLIFATFNALSKWKGGKTYQGGDKGLALGALITTHLQLVLGLILYFVSPKVIFEGASMKDAVMRFFLVEHPAIMLLAITLITIGYSRAKRATEDSNKFRLTFLFFLTGLILILLGIPWPFQSYGASWI